MKKILLAAIICIVIINTQAQLAFTYKAGINPDKSNYKVTWPYIANGFTNTVGLDYYFPLKENGTAFKLSANYVLSKVGETEVKEYAKQNKIDYKSYTLSKSNSGGMLLTGGFRFVLPQGAKAKVAVAIEAELGGFFGNGQVLNYYTAAGQPLKTIEGNKTLFVWNPHVDLYGRISKAATLKIMAGYSNVLGITAGLGIAISKGYKPPPAIIRLPSK